MTDERNTLFSRIKTLTRHSLVYGLFDFLGKAGALVLVPLYTKTLPPSDYGMIELFIVTGSLLLIAVVMGFNSALTRYYVTEDDPTERSHYFQTALTFVLILAGSFCAILSLVAPAASSLFFGTTDFAGYWRLVFATVFFDALGVMFLSLFRAQSLPVRYSWINLGKLLTTLVLNVLFVGFLRWGIFGVLLGNLFGSITGSSLGLLHTVRGLRLAISRRHLVFLWKFGAPLVVSGIGLFLMHSIDRYFVKGYTSLSDLGTYALAHKIGMVMSLTVNAFVVAWPPIMFKISMDPQAKETFSTVMTYFVLVTSCVLLGVGSFTDELVLVLSTESYLAGSKIVLLILLSYLLQGVYYILSAGVTVTDNTRVVPLVVTIGLLVNVAANIVLTPRFGIWGAATATALSHIALPTGMYLAGQHYYRITFDVRRIIRIAIITVAVLGVNIMFLSSFTLLNGFLKVVVLIAVPFLLTMTGFFTDEELSRGRTILMKLRVRFLP